jgi:integrase
MSNDKSSTDSKDLVGYDKLLSIFADYRDKTPKGIGLVRKGKQIYLQFKYPGTKNRDQYACNCPFTLFGIERALETSKKVADKLKTVSSASEFKEWYDSEILKVNEVKNDLLTFEQAFEIHRDRYFSRTDKVGRKRDKSSDSNLRSYYNTYYRFFEQIDNKSILLNSKHILATINNQATSRVKWDCKNAFLNLLDTIKYKSMYEQVKETTEDIKRPKFDENSQQTITLDEWLKLRDSVLKDKGKACQQYRLERQSWCWVFSMQIVYGLRISEIWAISNLDKPFKLPKGNKVIPALNDPNNKTNEIWVNDETIYGHTVKTGNRLAIPLIPPTHPNLIEELDIKNPRLPKFNFQSNNFATKCNKYSVCSRRKLESWSFKYLDKKFSQTHANRHLGNANAIEAGIPTEIRAKSMGHSPEMNNRVYQRWSDDTLHSTMTNFQRMPLGMNVARELAQGLINDSSIDKKMAIEKLLTAIYQSEVILP